LSLKIEPWQLHFSQALQETEHFSRRR
jgi:hypothetical protein